MHCENCGNNVFKEENGKIMCSACGTIIKTTANGHIGFKEELREKELKRIMDAPSYVSPKPGLLTDEEILKYAPESSAAKKIRYNNTNSLKEKILIKYDSTDAMIGAMLLFSLIISVYLILK